MIEFILNDNIIKTSKKTGVTLLQFIRENQSLKGTKSGCKEGDCGACTVLIGSLHKDNSIKYKSVTSCLTPLANIQNKHVVTVEGINLENTLTVCQKAMQDFNGTQCGFCTPGFVMSLTAYSLEKDTQMTSVENLGGNICRCTGYKSIEKAALSVEDLLQNNAGNMDWLVANNFVPHYFKTIAKKLSKLNTNTLANNNYVGGGSDIYVRHADTLAEQNVQSIAALTTNAITFSENECTLGGSTTVNDLLYNIDFQNYFPKLKKHLKLVSSAQIRNMGSIAGNFVNASPIGDMSIFFLALNAQLSIASEKGTERKIALKDFFLDYKKYDLQPTELIQEITFNLPPEKHLFNFEKVSKRTHLDIASVNTAISLNMIDQHTIKQAHVAIGGVAAIPKYLHKTSNFLKNKKITTTMLLEAQAILQTEITPISDVRGTKQYKRRLAQNLFYAHFIELFSNQLNISKLIGNEK